MVAQTNIGSSLQTELQVKNADPVRITVFLNDRVDLGLLNDQLNQDNVPVKDRPLIVKTALKAVADQTQASVLAQLAEYETANGLAHSNLSQLWIINAMSMDLDKELVPSLAEIPGIELIDLESARMLKPMERPMRSPSPGFRSPGGTETGLLAIKADFMWQMGYTGLNRISHSIDTGVWPDHPAIDDQFLGNYYPLDHAWFGYDSDVPVDKSSDHGTHTIGTALGVDQVTEDTIGVAPRAFYIASDPVATSLATVKPLTDFMFAFEWTFDPDGNPSTTSDIPDVINNSWGYDVPTDTELCTSYASEMFSAIQAAGIAGVFSAGNEGPNPSTISIPHHIATGLVNSFTVGAINADNPAFPIASFSSRGPTICPATGSLLIKPEVVAPGVNVRSAIRDGQYDNYQGTSMAGPHVTGSVLLLREAFPNVTGQEILMALYNSADDLGQVGEDNDYGMGMINLENAYNLLAQSHTPTPPNASTIDVSISAVESPEYSMTCDNAVIPQVKLTNNGSDPITAATITYSEVGGTDQTFNWTGNLNQTESETVTLPSLPLTQKGFTELWFRSSLPGNPVELNPHNNNIVYRFDRRAEEPNPFFEDFEHNELFDGTWLSLNDDADMTWDTTLAAGLPWTEYSAFMNYSNYSPRAEQEDHLISPTISLESDPAMKFEVSYTYVHQSFADTLVVSISADCGDNWMELYRKGGEDLATHPDNDEDFLPSINSHWRTEEIALSSFSDENVLVRFTGINRKGSNLVLDNIRIYSGTEPQSISEAELPQIALFPNPATNEVYLRSSISTEANISIMDLAGRTVKANQRKWLSHAGSTLDISSLNNGTYLVNVNTGSGTVVQPLVIAR